MRPCPPCVALLAALALAWGGCTATTPGVTSDASSAVVVPDNPRLRSWDNVLRPDCRSGRVLVRVGCVGASGRADRFRVPAGRVELTLVYEDTRDTVEDRRLTTLPVTFVFEAQAGREYRIRGLAFPPAGPAERAQAEAYRVVFAAQDTGSGEIVQKLEVDPAQNVWKDTSADLLTDLFS